MRLRSTLSRWIPDSRLDGVLRRLDRQKEVNARQRERMDKHGRRLAKVERTASILVKDCALLELQLGSLEAKFEQLARERDPVPITGDSQDVAEARNVLDLVQREHQQIRARFQIITRYEERLRRVEESLRASEESEPASPS